MLQKFNEKIRNAILTLGSICLLLYAGYSVKPIQFNFNLKITK